MRARAAKQGQTKPEAKPRASAFARHADVNRAMTAEPHAPAAGLQAAKANAAPNGFAHDFSRAPVFAKPPVGLPAKLYVNTPGDTYEREADRTAEEVMRTPNRPTGSGEPLPPPASLVRRAGGEAGGPEEVSSLVHPVLSSPGQPLDAATRAFMEPRFGHDFGDIRVHLDGPAAGSAEALHARAYTFSNHLVFAAGEYRPGTARGDKLLAHELAHSLQTAHGGAGTVRRDVVYDAAVNPTAVEFRVGTELTLDFVRLAQTLAGDGKIDDADLGQLVLHALNQRETVNDYERMFMAALLVPANVRKLKALRLSAATMISFPISTINAARVKHVIDLNRQSMPKSVAEPFGRFKAAVSGGDAAAAAKAAAQVEGEASKEIVAHAGPFKTQAADLIAFAQANKIELGGVLQAMLAAASDNSAGDKVMAGIAYAVAAHARSAMKDDLLQGRIKVDGMSQTAFVKVNKDAKNLWAFYVPAATAKGNKGDTIYMTMDFDINDLKQRSAVIHELRHAEDDKAASATDKITATDPKHFVPAEEAEARAYRTQARYILDQMAGLPLAEQQARAKKVVAAPVNELVFVAAVLEGQTNRRLYQPILELIFGASADPQVHQNPAGVAKMLGMPAARLERLFLQEIGKTFNAGQKALLEGLVGESRIHHIFRF